ncbi:complex I subunit 5 family protein [Myxococcota bacterium]|nr:complex I subunit 5 family protein [Myxococcota bacterium]
MNTAVAFIAAPLAVAFLLPLLGSRSSWGSRAAALLTLLALAAVGLLMLLRPAFPQVVVIGGWRAPFGISLYVDALSVMLVVLFDLLALFALWFQHQHGQEKPVSFDVLVLVLSAAAAGAVFTQDLFNLFVFLEITTVAALALSAPQTGSPRGVIRYWLFGSVASASMLLGIAILYSGAGTLNLVELGSRWSHLTPPVQWLSGVMILLGFLVKMEIVPFHVWAPSTYRAAPSSVGLLLSGVVTGLAAFSAWKFFALVLRGGASLPPVSGVFSFSQALFGLGALTLILGALAMLAEKDAKKLLAFSTISQMGLVLMAIALGNPRAVRAVFFLIFAHALGKSLLFFVTGLVVSRRRNSEWRSWHGLGAASPSLVWFWFLGTATIIGLPLFPGFWGKLTFIGGALEMGLWGRVGVMLLILATVCESVALLRVGHALWEREGEPSPRDEVPSPRVSGRLSYWAGALALSAAILWMGLWPAVFSRAFVTAQQAYAGDGTPSVVRTSTDAFAQRSGHHSRREGRMTHRQGRISHRDGNVPARHANVSQGR